MRLQKLMAQAGIDSRRACEKLIQEGKVMVNGHPALIGANVEDSDEVIVNGSVISKSHKRVYLMMNKPSNFITTVKDMYDRKTVMELIPPKYADLRLFPIGRLDRDAEGLLLMTNDGDFANSVIHPSKKITKTYRVWLDDNFSKEDKKEMEQGIRLNDGFVEYIRVYIVKRDCVDIKIIVGKNKIVKRLFRSLGFRVKRLIRTEIGHYSLGNLKQGHVKEFNPKKAEIEKVKKPIKKHFIPNMAKMK